MFARPMRAASGDRFPEVELRRSTGEPVATGELTRGRTVVLFGVPGAFTPTCSDTHLPGYVTRADDLRAAGADEIACVAVNDAFVMAAWAEASGAGAQLTFLADGNGTLAEALGLELDASRFGMGTRLRRFAAVVRDGVVEYLEAEAGPEVGVSGAETVLERLRSL